MISNYIEYALIWRDYCSYAESLPLPPSYLEPSEDTAHACGHGFGDFGF